MSGHYNVGLISAVVVIVYLTSFILSRTGRIRPATHRAVWNIVLLVAFLATGLMGLGLAVLRDTRARVGTPFNIGFWHVETGVVLTLVALFHIGWHLGYFQAVLAGAREAEHKGRKQSRDSA